MTKMLTLAEDKVNLLTFLNGNYQILALRKSL